MTAPLALRFLKSAAEPEQLATHSRAEIAIVGRSNVGKSSLINALAERKQLAKTSQHPGATRLMNLYEFVPEGSGRFLVDLPGYGFAKVSKTERDRWQRMIDRYVLGREQLVGVLHLIDGEVGPTPLDLQVSEWLRHNEIGIMYVATKWDKVSSSRRGPRAAELVAKLEVTHEDVIWVSAVKGVGIDQLRSEILRSLEG